MGSNRIAHCAAGVTGMAGAYVGALSGRVRVSR
jgi:hypothetical protein